MDCLLDEFVICSVWFTIVYACFVCVPTVCLYRCSLQMTCMREVISEFILETVSLSLIFSQMCSDNNLHAPVFIGDVVDLQYVFVSLVCCLGGVACVCVSCWCCAAVWSMYTSTNLHMGWHCTDL